MKIQIAKHILPLLACWAAVTSTASASGYTKVNLSGNSVVWNSQFPEEILGVVLTVTYRSDSPHEDGYTERRFFAAEESIRYPFESEANSIVLGDGFYKWEMSLVVAGANLLEKSDTSGEVGADHDENGRSIDLLARHDNLVNLHRKIDESVRVTSGHFRVRTGNIVSSDIAEKVAEQSINK